MVEYSRNSVFTGQMLSVESDDRLTFGKRNNEYGQLKRQIGTRETILFLLDQ